MLDIAVHVNDESVVMREFCNRDCFVGFSARLGELVAGDMIYVGVGPSGVDYNDRYRLGFYVVREVDPHANTRDRASLRDEPVGDGSKAADHSDSTEPNTSSL